jgi:hypothetical protein
MLSLSSACQVSALIPFLWIFARRSRNAGLLVFADGFCVSTESVGRCLEWVIQPEMLKIRLETAI